MHIFTLIGLSVFRGFFLSSFLVGVVLLVFRLRNPVVKNVVMVVFKKVVCIRKRVGIVVENVVYRV